MAPKVAMQKSISGGSVHTDGNYGTTIIVVFDSYLVFPPGLNHGQVSFL